MKDVLVHVRDFRAPTPAAAFGVRLAGMIGALVTGVYACRGAPSLPPSIAAEAMAAVAERTRLLIEEAVRAGQSFIGWAGDLGAERAEWVVAEGETSDVLVEAAVRHDLLVLDHAIDDAAVACSLPGVILRAGVPCILVPPRPRVPWRPFERIAIAWNGSPESMRAVHAALPFVEGRSVLLLRGEERELSPALSWTPPFDVVEYLTRRGALVEERAIVAKRDDAGGTLLEEALQFEADLFVMGAYGRSRFSEWLLGGVTRYALTWADIPVLLKH